MMLIPNSLRFHTAAALLRSALMLTALLVCVAGVSRVSLAQSLPAAVDGQPLPSLAPMLETVTPAVVNISTRGPMRERNPLMDDPFFRRFFDLPSQSEAPQPQSLGSGVIVDAERGLVVTNSHVIENAAVILVTLSDGREALAEVVGSDPQADIAVIRVDEPNLTALPWADSSELRVGDFCVAIGNPFGLGQTVTSGIVSALGRSGLGIEDFEDFIQTDASINPGNSGGALVNLRGELIGINTAIVGPSGGNVGIGFAIPSNMASDLMEQLVEFGEVRRGALGIAAQSLTPDLARAFKTGETAGVIITGIRPDSPAKKAGLQVGDLIVSIDGRKMRDIRAVKNRIGLVRLGQLLRMNVIRDGKPIEIAATIEELMFSNPLLEGAEFSDEKTRNGRRFVLLQSVDDSSTVAEYGLRSGDIILSVNQQPVETVEELEALAERDQQQILLLVQRGQSTQYVRLQAE